MGRALDEPQIASVFAGDAMPDRLRRHVGKREPSSDDRIPFSAVHGFSVRAVANGTTRGTRASMDAPISALGLFFSSRRRAS